MSAWRCGRPLRVCLFVMLGVTAAHDDAAAAEPLPASDEAARDAAIFGPSDGEAARDAEIFGTGEKEREGATTPGEAAAPTDSLPRPTAQSASAAPTSSPRASAAAPPPTSAAGTTSPADAMVDDWLDVGGLLYLSMQYSALHRGEPAEFPLESPSFGDVYLDARPSERLRGTVRGRLEYDGTVRPGSVDALGQERQGVRVLLDQMWLKVDAFESIFFTIGKQPIRWGSNRFWNPTDFLNQQKRDPLAIIDQRTGVNLVKVHVPVEANGWNFYGIVNFDEADAPSKVGAALRAELLFGETEVALSYAVRENDPQRLGIDVSTGLWLFDLHAEVAGQYGVRTPFYRGSLDFESFTLPSAYSRRDEWVVQAAGGGEISFKYSDEDSVMLGAEYFYNDAGYGTSALYPWLAAQGQFIPLYLGRHYGAVYVSLPNPGSWNHTWFTLSLLSNISDGSYLGRLDYQVSPMTHLDLNLFAAYHFGANGELNYGVRIPPNPDVPGLEQGIVVEQPELDLGVALRIAL